MRALALPTKRDELWRWADLSALTAAAASLRGDAAEAAWIGLGGPRLVFVDGVLDMDASAPGPIAVGPLAVPTDHALGSRTAGTGWTLDLAAGEAGAGVEIVHVSTGGENHLPGRIVLGEEAAATVVETYVGTGWVNRLTAVDLARGARLQRAVRVLADTGYVSTRDEVRVAAGGHYAATMLAAGDAGARFDAALALVGDGAFAEMGGALLTRAEGRQECAVRIRHAAVGGQSNQTWRAVAADASTASLAAAVEVARDAQQTDGEQSLRGLLLKRTATVNLKPELEIFADDVKCAHGATVGELDARAIFYMESRGIAPARARALMTRAFVADALERIADEGVRAAFVADADVWLERAL